MHLLKGFFLSVKYTFVLEDTPSSVQCLPWFMFVMFVIVQDHNASWTASPLLFL